MKKMIKEKGKWIILLIAVLLFVIIVDGIFEQDIDKFDNITYNMISFIINPVLTIFFKGITHCGDWIIMVPLCIILLFTVKKQNYKIAILLNIVIIFVLNQFMKVIFTRTRPTQNVLIDASGYSFPSGHSMVSMAFYGLLIYLTYKNIKKPFIRNAICFGLTILILLIGISRIYLGVHFASDVIGGFCVSIAYLVVFVSILKEKLENKTEKC